MKWKKDQGSKPHCSNDRNYSLLESETSSVQENSPPLDDDQESSSCVPPSEATDASNSKKNLQLNNQSCSIISKDEEISTNSKKDYQTRTEDYVSNIAS